MKPYYIMGLDVFIKLPLVLRDSRTSWSETLVPN